METGFLLNLLVTLALVVLMMSVGLRLDWARLAELRRRPLFLLAVTAVNFLAVPALTVALLAVVQPNSAVAAGFLIASVCPGAPYGPSLAAAAKGDASAAVGLMVLLAASSAVVAPLLLSILLPFVAPPDSMRIDGLAIATRLIATQLLPLGCGALFRIFCPKWAEHLERPIAAASVGLNLAAIGLILVYFLPDLLHIRPLGFAGIMVLVLGSAAFGRLCGGANRALGRSAMVTTAVKNLAVALVITSGLFPGGPAVVAVVAYGLLGVLMTAALAKWMGR